MAGLYFEQFSVGQTFVHEIRRTVTDMDNILFCSLTYNPAAVHIDHHYAAGTEFGKPLMNSIFTLGLIIKPVGAGHHAGDHGRQPRHGGHPVSEASLRRRHAAG